LKLNCEYNRAIHFCIIAIQPFGSTHFPGALGLFLGDEWTELYQIWKNHRSSIVAQQLFYISDTLLSFHIRVTQRWPGSNQGLILDFFNFFTPLPLPLRWN